MKQGRKEREGREGRTKRGRKEESERKEGKKAGQEKEREEDRKLMLPIIPYSGYFLGGEGDFCGFVVERQTTKFLPMKQYRIVWCSHT